MNSEFTHEQIRAYSAQFREGDAIFVNDNWERVIARRRFEVTTENDEIDNSFLINRDVGVVEGFRIGRQVAHPYRVTALEHYELQGGEKIIWLGESDDFRTFGKVYEVNSDAKYRDNEGGLLPAVSTLWGVIPRYEQVKNLGKTTITERVNEVIKDKMNTDRPASSHYHTNNNGNDVWQFADDNLSDERVKGFHQVNALKYIARYEKKHDTAEKRIEDLEKAKVSIDKLIELERKSEE